MSQSSTQQISQAIFATLAYTDQFDFPLTSDEIFQRMVNSSGAPDAELEKSQFEFELKKIVKKMTIGEQDGFFFLPHRNKIIGIRQRRDRVASQKYWEVGRFVNQVKFIPFVQAIFVTGSLAMRNSTEHQDIDFMIVTQKGTLWLCRPLVMLIAGINGKRRHFQGKEDRKWCLNLWIDTSAMQIPAERRSVYVAYEVIQAKPVFERNNTVELFYKQNRWIKEYLPNWSSLSVKKTKGKKKKGRGGVGTGIGQVISATWAPLFSAANFAAYFLQKTYMQKHRTSERIGVNFAFFHPRNTEQMIFTGWKKSFSATFGPNADTIFAQYATTTTSGKTPNAPAAK